MMKLRKSPTMQYFDFFKKLFFYFFCIFIYILSFLFTKNAKFLFAFNFHKYILNIKLNSISKLTQKKKLPTKTQKKKFALFDFFFLKIIFFLD